MSQIVQRINEKIISDVVNRHRAKFNNYHRLKSAVSALMGEASYFDILDEDYAMSAFIGFPGVRKVMRTAHDPRLKKYFSLPTAETAEPWYPLIAQWGYVLDGRIVSAKDFVTTYEKSRPNFCKEYADFKREVLTNDVQNYETIIRFLGVKPVIRVSINLNYEG